MRKLAVLVAILSLFGIAAAFYYVRFQPDAAAYPVQGIDVSHHQGAIRWSEVAANGVAFAYIKATEGVSYKDRHFVENWNNAAKANVTRGAYHFFTLCRSAAEQARNFIAFVPKDANALPPAIDLEFGGNCTSRPESAAVKASLAAMVETLTVTYGKPPVFYVTREFYNAYGGALPEGAHLWVRSIAWRPLFGGKAWKFWQYHNRGSVAGIEGPVDRNVFNGSIADFRAYVAGGPSSTVSN